MSNTENNHGRFGKDPLMPYWYEIAWFSFGAFLMGVSKSLALIAVGFLLVGGFVGGLAYNRRLKQEET